MMVERPVMVEKMTLISEIVATLLEEGHSGAAWKIASEYGISYDEFLEMEEDYA